MVHRPEGAQKCPLSQGDTESSVPEASVNIRVSRYREPKRWVAEGYRESGARE